MESCASKKPPSKGRYCSVPLCQTKEGPGISIFNVLRKDKSQSSKWIERINRLNPDGSAWEPRKRDFVCEKHFFEGKPSKDQLDPDYVPTLLMPKSHQKSYKIQDKLRHQRVNQF